ncbi:MAG: type II toxin-antitoxin system VapC family toxin [Limnothrix sp.]
MLLDSNIIIYAAQSENQFLRDFIAKHSPCVSVISYLEVLGYHRLTTSDRKYFEAFFYAAQVLEISQNVIVKAIDLKQTRKISLGDSLIASTALVNNLALVTRNVEDFVWVPQLEILNPFDD